MQILRVELQNIKSYREAAVTFDEGVNAIYGQNGAGKSTILEAIGFALFHTLPYNQEEFVRKGERKGRVGVTFESAGDGVIYTVEREIGTSSSCRVYGPAGGRPLTEGVIDTRAWLKDHLGVPDNVELNTLFEQAVGVVQGSLTAAFLLTESPRRGVFDPLLRVDEYEKAWNQLLALTRYCEGWLSNLDRDIQTTGGELLPDREKERNRLVALVADDRACHSEIEDELAEIKAERTELRAAEASVGRLEQDSSNTQRDVEDVGRRHCQAQQSLEDAEEARRIVDKTRDGYEKYAAALIEEGELEERRRMRDDISRRLAAIRIEETEMRGSAKRLGEQLEELDQACEEMNELGPQVAVQDALDEEIDDLRQSVRSYEEAERRHRKETEELRRLEIRHETVSAEVEERDDLSNQIAGLAERIQEAGQEIARLQAERVTLEQSYDQLVDRVRVLEETEGAKCPVCQEPLSEAKADKLRKDYQDELVRTESGRSQIADDLEVWAEKRAGWQEERDRLVTERDRRATQGQLDDLLERIAEQEVEVETWRNQKAEHEGAAGNLEKKQGELDILGDPRTRYKLLAEQVANESSIRDQWERATAAAKAKKEAVGTLEEELELYHELDDALGVISDTKRRHADDHTLYLTHKSEASKVEELRGEAERLAEALQQANEKLQRIAVELEVARESYDAERHEVVEKRFSELATAQAVVADRLERNQEQLITVEEAIEDLQNKLSALRSERKRAKATGQAAVNIRRMIRDAGPMIASVLTQDISQEASETFSAIMNDYALTLSWDNSYEIKVERGGYTRVFNQLSGGEKMAAAVAVRLALLKRMSNVDVAFFDEPTSNLDDTRRDSLAEQVTAIKGFSQLFVISHDDAFERTAGKAIHIDKEGGLSRIVEI